jgi:hypothetical protein
MMRMMMKSNDKLSEKKMIYATAAVAKIVYHNLSSFL